MPDSPLIKWNNNICNCWTTTDRQCNIFKCKQKIWYWRFSELSVQCCYSTVPLSILTSVSLLVINSDTDDLWPHMECEKQKKADTGETSLAKVTHFFYCIRIPIRWCCSGVLISPYPDLLPTVFCLMMRMLVLLYIYIQGVPGGMCQTSGGCSLC